VAQFRKKIYRLDGLARDLAWLAAHSPEVAGIAAGRTVTPAWRERIMLAVARVNECRYCVYAHTDAARHAGLSDDAIDGPPVGGDEALAVEYASALAADGFGPVDPALEAAVVAALGEHGRRRVEVTARYMTVANLTGNTVDALLARFSGEPAPDSRLFDEAVIGAVWSLGAAISAWNIWRGRGGSPLDVLNDFRSFSRGYDGA